jgi:hypothetical protein
MKTLVARVCPQRVMSDERESLAAGSCKAQLHSARQLQQNGKKVAIVLSLATGVGFVH